MCLVALFVDAYLVCCCRAVQVRVDAVAALRNLVEAFDDDHLDSIKPLLPELLNLLFALMVEVMAAPCCFASFAECLA